MAGLGIRGVLRGASIVGTGMVLSKAISLAAETVVARELSTSEFGAAIFAYTTLLTLSGILLVGIPEGFAYFLSIFDERGEGRAAFRMIISGISILAIVLSLGVIAIYVVPLRIVEGIGISKQQWRWFTLLAPLVVAYPVSRVSFGIMRGYDIVTPKVLSDDVLNKTISILALGIAIWQGPTEFIFLSFYLGQYLLSGLLGGGYVLFLIRAKVEEISLCINFGTEARQLLSYSWPLALKNATRRILGSTDILLIGTLLVSSSAVGYYRVGYVISQLAMMALIAISYLYTPRIARLYNANDTTRTAELYQRATKWGTLLTFPIVLPLLCYPEMIIETIFGQEYRPGGIILLILSIDVLFRVALGPASATLQGINRTKPDFGITAVTTLMNLGFSYVLVLRYGVVGAAVGTMISMLLLNSIQTVLVYRYTGFHPYSRKYVEGIVSIFVGGILLSAIINEVAKGVSLEVIGVPVSILGFVFLFPFVEFAIVWFGGLLSQTEKERLWEKLYNKPFDALR